MWKYFLKIACQHLREGRGGAKEEVMEEGGGGYKDVCGGEGGGKKIARRAENKTRSSGEPMNPVQMITIRIYYSKSPKYFQKYDSIT